MKKTKLSAATVAVNDTNKAAFFAFGNIKYPVATGHYLESLFDGLYEIIQNGDDIPVYVDVCDSAGTILDRVFVPPLLNVLGVIDEKELFEILLELFSGASDAEERKVH